MSNLELVALVVRDYDAAIHFFVDVLQFELVEDSASLTNDGRPKRWDVCCLLTAAASVQGPHAVTIIDGWAWSAFRPRLVESPSPHRTLR